jgi:hypothetical protein
MYFGTAQGACCIAIHQMLLQTFGDKIELFPALPSSWESTSFDNLLAAGLEVSAKWTPQGVEWAARNISEQRLARQICYGEQSVTLDLAPGEERRVAWSQ